jgi:hypothetical protein
MPLAGPRHRSRSSKIGLCGGGGAVLCLSFLSLLFEHNSYSSDIVRFYVQDFIIKWHSGNDCQIRRNLVLFFSY